MQTFAKMCSVRIQICCRAQRFVANQLYVVIPLILKIVTIKRAILKIKKRIGALSLDWT
jgi:hypothetical protein